LNNFLDIKIIKNEVKLINYHNYISTFFVNYEFRNQLLLILFLDIELNKIINSNIDNSLIEAKLEWWKISCTESISGKYFAVPSLRLVKKYFYKNKIISNELTLLITSLKDYYFENSINKKIKKYSRYLLIKNKIIFHILNIEPLNINIKKSLNFLVLFKSNKDHNNLETSIKFYNKSKKIYNRADKKFLILYLLNTNNYFTKRNLYKKLFIKFTSYW
tara:strand:- start:467 stop:1120 length:654 start_codon:yes stop_codon:yes gene_type:complete